MRAHVISLFLLVTGYLNAQVQFSSLDELLHYADKHAISIQSVRLQEEVALSQSKQSQSFLYPSLNAVVGYTNNLTIQPTLVPMKLFNPAAPDGTFQEMTFGRQHSYTTGLSAQWDLVNFQRIFAARAAGVQKKAAALATEVTSFSVYNELANTYYSIILTQYAIRLYTENEQLTGMLLASSREKYTRGIISEAELNAVTMRHLQNEKTLMYNQYQLQQLVLQLQVKLGTNEAIRVSGDLDSL